MRVLNISGGQDTGGNAWRAYDAFRRLRPDWTYDVQIPSQTYIGYPVPQRFDRVEAARLWEAADVVHVRNNWAVESLFDTPPPARPSVIHHHGTVYRSLHEPLMREAARRRAISACATLDLWLIHPDDSVWLPSIYDVEWLAGFRDPQPDDGVLRIGHAPTDRRIKSTQRLIRAVDRLRDDGVNVELDLIEGERWGECLRRKGKLDIYFDQVLLGYGNNAIEAMAMGIPVVAGAADATLAEYAGRFGSVPFVEAQEGSIYQALRQLLDPAERELWGKRGVEHVRQWHDERNLIGQLTDLYTRAVDAW